LPLYPQSLQYRRSFFSNKSELTVAETGRIKSNTRPKRVRLTLATPADAEELAALHTTVSEDLTSRFGKGPWSMRTTGRGVLHAMRMGKVFVAKRRNRCIATLTLVTKKPWAIDTRYFTACKRPLYLLGMAVLPALQRQGLGSECLEEAKKIARKWPADAIRLDAFDADAGAGGFYARCGLREVGRVTYRGAPLVYFECLP
jgi:GNAT superfamily N-acetyltransferase